MAEAPPPRDAQPLGWPVLLPPWLSELAAIQPTPPPNPPCFPGPRSRQPEVKARSTLEAAPQARAREGAGAPVPQRGGGSWGEAGITAPPPTYPACGFQAWATHGPLLCPWSIVPANVRPPPIHSLGFSGKPVRTPNRFGGPWNPEFLPSSCTYHTVIVCSLLSITNMTKRARPLFLLFTIIFTVLKTISSTLMGPHKRALPPPQSAPAPSSFLQMRNSLCEADLLKVA